MKRAAAVSVLVLSLFSCREINAPDGATTKASPGMASVGTLASIADAAWRTHNRMPAIRMYPGAVTQGNGVILVAGGKRAGPFGEISNESYVYIASRDSWQQDASLPYRLYGHSMVRSSSGATYVIGGFESPDGFSGAATNHVWRYDPAAGGYQNAPSMHTARNFAAAAATSDGKIYVTGGIGPSNSAEVFNEATGTWTNLPPMRIARQNHAMAVGSDGRIYAIGGIMQIPETDPCHAGAVSEGRYVEAYDPASNSWSEVERMPLSRHSHGAAVGRDGRIYVVGGMVGGACEGLTPSLDNDGPWAFDVATQHWIQHAAPQLNLPRQALAVIADPDGGRLWALGGFDGGDASNFNESLDIFAPVVMTLTSSVNPTVSGQITELTATVANNAAPDGAFVEFKEFDTLLGRVAIHGGTATFPIKTLSVGEHWITATWSTGQSPTLSQMVNKAATVLTAQPLGPTTYGRTFPFVVDVTAAPPGSGVPTGLIRMRVDGVTLAIVAPENGHVLGPDMFDLEVGTHVVSIQYAPGSDPYFLSKALSYELVVNPGLATTTLTQSTNRTIAGEPFTLTATLSDYGQALAPTGSVTFTSQGVAIGTAPLSGTTATLSVSLVDLGKVEIQAEYKGDGNFDRSLSNPLGHIVDPPPNSAPIANAGGPYAGSEGTGFAFNGSASSDPDNDALTYDWDFGDGTSAANAGATPTHRYEDNGNYRVTLTVDDRHGHTAQASANVSIANIAPVVSTSGGATIMAGDTFTGSCSFTDVPNDTHTGAVNWGDGQSESLALSGHTCALSHAYAAAGTFTVTVTITDDDGTPGSATATVVVQSPAAATTTVTNNVQNLVTSGAITGQVAGQLTQSLDAAVASLASGNTTAGSNQLSSFINKVQAGMNSGKISAADGAALIAAANHILAGI